MIILSSLSGNLWGILVWLAIGALTGWVATIIFGSKGSLLKYILIGLLGSVVGGWLGSLIGVSGGIFISFGTSVLGAGVLIIVLRFFKLIK